MNVKQFHSLVNGTQIQITSRSGDDVAYGRIVNCQEYNNRGSLVNFNKLKITEATADGMWAKYLKRPAQAGFSAEHMALLG